MKNITLFSPGPTPLSENCLSTLSKQPIHHRSSTFKQIIKESMELLSLLFDEEHKLAFCSTGSGALEASVVNFMSSSDTAITLDGGKFGERWGDILKAYKINHFTHKFNWGKTPNLEQLKKLIITHQPQALFMQACETSTATQYDVAEIAQILKLYSSNTLLIVDGVTAVGAYPLSMKGLKIDVLITGSQKSLGLPTGLSFMGFSNNALEASQKSNLPKFYFNVLKELKNLNDKSTTTFSSPVQLWQALHQELQSLEKTGLHNQFQKCLELQSMVLAWATKNNIELFSDSPSPSLTALKLSQEINASDVQSLLLTKGYFIATGQDKYKEQIIRIGHMKNITPKMMTLFLKNLSLVLDSLTSKALK